MRVTNTFATFELLEEKIQKSAIFSSSDRKSFCNLLLLHTMHKKEKPDFGTFELNIGQILDGSFRHLSDTDKIDYIAFMSQKPSNAECKFENTWVEARFTELKDFIGITLDFGDNYPKKIKVEFFKNNEEIGYLDIIEVKDNFVFVNFNGDKTNKVRVTFIESRFPYQYAYLQEFIFGKIIDFYDDDIISANFQEETDVISKVLPNDTLNLVIYSEDDDFNILRYRGLFSFLRVDQKFKVYETVTDQDTGETTKYFVGNFYLESWKTIANKQISFNLVSPLGLLDKTQFKKGKIYKKEQNNNAKKVLEEIFTDAGFDINKDVEIDPSLSKIILEGYIPVCTHKQAIQHVAFVCDCIVTDTRSEKISINPYELLPVVEIETTNIFDPVVINKKEQVTALDIEVHNYVLKGEQEEIFKGKLKPGINHEITFKEPCIIEEYPQGLTVIERETNYLIVKVATEAEYSIVGFKYEDKKYTYSVKADGDFTKQNIVNIAGATLINPNNCNDLSNKLLQFYQKYNLTVEFEFISNYELTGQEVFFRTFDGKFFKGSFVRQNIALTSGYKSKSYIIGKQEIQYKTHDYYSIEATRKTKDEPETGNAVDIYTGEPFGLI